MLKGLNAPAGALVVLDRGIVSEANLAWLRENGYRYLVMSRERRDLEQAAQTLKTANGAPIHWQRIPPTGQRIIVRRAGLSNTVNSRAPLAELITPRAF